MQKFRKEEREVQKRSAMSEGEGNGDLLRAGAHIAAPAQPVRSAGQGGHHEAYPKLPENRQSAS